MSGRVVGRLATGEDQVALPPRDSALLAARAVRKAQGHGPVAAARALPCEEGRRSLQRDLHP